MNRHRYALLGLMAAMAGCSADRVRTAVGPEPLRPPSNQSLTVASHGIGVQIYECRQDKGEPTHFAWALKAPEARLHYDSGRDLGKHYGGPTWEALDGSKVIGEVVAHADSPDGTAIPWLLLRATSTSGTGVFTGVQSIQRLRTAGGKAPVSGCESTYAGTEVRVAYSADYYFYSAKP